MTHTRAPDRLPAGVTLELLLATPIMMTFLMGIVTFSLAMFAASHAANAAAHAARMASIDLGGDREATARREAAAALAVLPLSQDWTVAVCDGAVATACQRASSDLGQTMRVEVHWSIPNFVGMLMPGIPDGPLEGIGSAVFRNEGW